MRHFTLATITTVILLVGCDSSSGGTATTPFDATDYCQWLLDCPTTQIDWRQRRAHFLASADPMAACLAWYERVEANDAEFGLRAAIAEAAGDGSVMPHGPFPSGANCSWAPFSMAPGEAGDTPIGAPCTVPGECVPDAFCPVVPFECGAVCQPKRDVGELCSMHEYCKSGTCEDSACLDMEFVTGAGEGESCADEDLPGLIRIRTSCADGLFCATLTATCERLPGLGEPCDQVCAEGVCLVDYALPEPHRCVELVIVAEGEPCDGESHEPYLTWSGTQKRVCDDYDGVECLAGFCTRPAPGNAGDYCANFDGFDSCALGMICNVSSGPGTCEARGSESDPCTYDEDCLSGTCDIAGTWTCLATYCGA